MISMFASRNATMRNRNADSPSLSALTSLRILALPTVGGSMDPGRFSGGLSEIAGLATRCGYRASTAQMTPSGSCGVAAGASVPEAAALPLGASVPEVPRPGTGRHRQDSTHRQDRAGGLAHPPPLTSPALPSRQSHWHQACNIAHSTAVHSGHLGHRSGRKVCEVSRRGGCDRWARDPQAEDGVPASRSARQVAIRASSASRPTRIPSRAPPSAPVMTIEYPTLPFSSRRSSGQGRYHRDDGDEGDQHVQQVGVQAAGLQPFRRRDHGTE